MVFAKSIALFPCTGSAGVSPATVGVPPTEFFNRFHYTTFETAKPAQETLRRLLIQTEIVPAEVR